VLSKEDITDSAIRRLIFEAGDDLEDLMLLCEADITSKNDAKVKRYLANYELVRRKIAEVEARDHIRNFQPPVSGEEVMRLFNLPPCKTVGILKNAVKEAILDGVIPNERTAALNFLMEEARKLGLEPVNSP
jgi:poly(A) polymerase